MNDNSSIERALELLTIGAGGFFGAISRFLIAGQLGPASGTLFVNVLGSILLGFLMYNSEYLGYVSPRTRMFFGIGFLGSLTTFSTFTVQTFQMPLIEAAFNVIANVLLTLAGVFAGRGFVVYIVKRREGSSGL
ncbi:fluoride efflux transporter CrcB [Methanolobus mangrovi]|uniref:Fluoride-specific ion channel FluC n=1 Tax=Methanolobus mangrovi TaxID=3072977 RepID=A0AA51UFT2_9EURY|nr:fluoride efflux transporter CrcB [Methanolobus mangrovi]WMW22163.1 fluoride efflux transporter CrcB [Methanolobus mangrovi]